MMKQRVGGERRSGLRPGASLTAIGLVLWLGGCSALPDSLDPSEWVREIDRTFSSEEVVEDPAQEARLRAERAVPIPGQDEPFPNLAEVPNAAPPITGPQARDRIANALISDRANARYSGTTIPDINGPDYNWTDLPPLQPLDPAPPEAGVDAQSDTGVGRKRDSEAGAQSNTDVGSSPESEVAQRSVVDRVDLPPPVATPHRAAEAEDDKELLLGSDKSLALVESMPRAPFDMESAREPASSSVVVERVPVDQIMLPQLPLSEESEGADLASAAPAETYEAPVRVERLERQTAPAAPEKAMVSEPATVVKSAEDGFPEREVAEAVLSEQAGTGLGPGTGARADPTIVAPPLSYNDTFDRMFAASEPAPADARAEIVGGTVAVAAAVGDTTLTRAPLSATDPMHVAVIYFNHGSSRLSKRDRDVLDKIVESLRDTDGTIRVIGHASSRTRYNDIASHKLANYDMSVDRAESVAEILIRRGIPRERVMVEAVSDNAPVNSEATPLGEAANRRADIYFEPGRRTY